MQKVYEVVPQQRWLMVHRCKKEKVVELRWCYWRCRGLPRMGGVKRMWQNLQQTRRSQETQVP